MLIAEWTPDPDSPTLVCLMPCHNVFKTMKNVLESAKVKGRREGLGGDLGPPAQSSSQACTLLCAPHPTPCIHSEQGHRKSFDVELLLALRGRFPLHAGA